MVRGFNGKPGEVLKGATFPPKLSNQKKYPSEKANRAIGPGRTKKQGTKNSL